MNRRKKIVVAGLILVGLAGAQYTATATTTLSTEKEWRPLRETTNLSLATVQSLCPTDGITPCTGALAGWVWGTETQVNALAVTYGLGVTVGGRSYFLPALRFVTALGPTSACEGGSFSYCEGASGYVSSGRVAEGYYQYPLYYGSFRTRSMGGDASPHRGVYLWRSI